MTLSLPRSILFTSSTIPVKVNGPSVTFTCSPTL